MNGLVNRETGEVVPNSVLSPIALDQVVASFQAYQGACEKLLTDSDHQVIQGKKFKKKSAWRKLATAYCISTRIMEERRDKLEDGLFIYHFTVRAEANNGRYAEGVGSCSSGEKGLLKTEHNTRSIAETRATNRAISNLIGAGEVSAEEISEESSTHKIVREVFDAEEVHESELSDKQLKRLFAISKANDLSNDEVKEIMKARCQVESSKDLTKAQYNMLCDELLPEAGRIKKGANI
jgi:hypothetical protein